jgi:hypothetical protein
MGRNGPKQSHAIVSLTSPGSEHRILFVYCSLVRHSLQSQNKMDHPCTENIHVWNVRAVDPHRIWSTGLGSGARWLKMTHKKFKSEEKMYCFEMLNILVRAGGFCSLDVLYGDLGINTCGLRIHATL